MYDDIVYYCRLMLGGLLLLWVLVASKIYVESYGQGGCGTGFFINDKGYLVTAAHVVGNNGLVILNGYPVFGYVVVADRLNDIAIIKTGLTNTGYYILNTNFKQGVIHILGYPEPDDFGYNLKDTIGHGRTGFSIFTGQSRTSFDSTIFDGNSGSPILDNRGQVVGMATIGFTGFGRGFGPTADQIALLAGINGISLMYIPENPVTPMTSKVIFICVPGE